jgi:hypothetical protein
MSFIEITSSLRRLPLPRHSDDEGGGIPYYKRPSSLLPKGQAATQEIPQSCLLRDDDGACGSDDK